MVDASSGGSFPRSSFPEHFSSGLFSGLEFLHATILQGVVVQRGWGGGSTCWFNFLEPTVRTFDAQVSLAVSVDTRVRQKGGNIGEVSEAQRRLRLR